MPGKGKKAKKEAGAAGAGSALGSETATEEPLTASSIVARMFEGADGNAATMRQQLVEDLESDAPIAGLDAARALATAGRLRLWDQPTVGRLLSAVAELCEPAPATPTTRTTVLAALDEDPTVEGLRAALQASEAQGLTAALAMIDSLEDGCDAADLREVVDVAFGFAEAPLPEGAAEGEPTGTKSRTSKKLVAPLVHLYDEIYEDEDDDAATRERKVKRSEAAQVRRLRSVIDDAAENPNAALDRFSASFAAGRMEDDEALDPLHLSGATDDDLLKKVRYYHEQRAAIAKLPISEDERSLRYAYLMVASSDSPFDPTLVCDEATVKASSQFVVKRLGSRSSGRELLAASRLAHGTVAKYKAGTGQVSSFDPAELNNVHGFLGAGFQKVGEIAASAGQLEVVVPFIRNSAVKSMETGFETVAIQSRDRHARCATIVQHYKEMLEMAEDSINLRKAWAFTDNSTECTYAAFRYFKICQVLANFIMFQHSQIEMSSCSAFITRLSEEALEALIHAALVDHDEKPPEALPARGRKASGSRAKQTDQKAAKKSRPRSTADKPAQEAWSKASKPLLAARVKALEMFKRGAAWSALGAHDQSTVLAIAHGDHSFRFQLQASDEPKRVAQTLNLFRRFAKSWKVPTTSSDPDAGVAMIPRGSPEQEPEQE